MRRQCGMRSVECGSVGCGVWDAECVMRSVGCGVWDAECGMRSVGCGVWDAAVWEAECGMRQCGMRQCGRRSVGCGSVAVVVFYARWWLQRKNMPVIHRARCPLNLQQRSRGMYCFRPARIHMLVWVRVPWWWWWWRRRRRRCSRAPRMASFAGPIPSELAGLAKLRILELHDNALDGACVRACA
jgi:hypothetical protein